MIITNELKEMFHVVRTFFGADIRTVELSDDALCDLLALAIGDYSIEVQKFITKSNWLNLMGQRTSLLSTSEDLAFALTTRTMDWSRSYSEWFSKEVGLNARGTTPKYELKKDFIPLEAGKQVYVIPAGREVNRVMWITPSTTKAALFAQNGGLGFGFDGGLGPGAQIGGAAGFNGFYGYFGSAYDTALYSADLKYKNQFFRGDLAYKITLGPNGTHLLHLLSVPGPKNPMTFGNRAIDDKGWGQYKDCYVWYDYYETDGSEEQTEECRLEHADTLIVSPCDVPLKKMKFELMNEQAQMTIRQLLIAQAAISLAFIRGKFGGEVSIPNATMKMDYGQLMEFGKSERERVYNDLKEYFESILPWNLVKNHSDMADSTMNLLKQKPLPGFYIR